MPRTNRRTPVTLAAALLLSLVACGGATAPTGPAATDPRFAISDGAFGGNPHFYWLPPTTRETPRFSGVFASGLLNQELRVTVCVWDGTACGATVAHFDKSGGTGGAKLAENKSSPSYRVTWLSSYCDQAALCPLKPGTPYRMSASVSTSTGPKELGYIDIKVVKTLAEQIAVDRTQYVPLMVGRPLGIAFRVEQGY